MITCKNYLFNVKITYNEINTTLICSNLTVTQNRTISMKNATFPTDAKGARTFHYCFFED